MRRVRISRVAAFIGVSLLHAGVSAEQLQPTAAVPAAEPLAAPLPAAATIIPRDTPVHLMVFSEVTTKTHPAGHRFRLRVDQPIMLGERIVIPVGTPAWGEVTSATSSGNVGKGGALQARLLYVELNGRQIPITGETASRGRAAGPETAMAVLALGPLGLFAKGNNAKIKAGERMTAFTATDFPLDAPAASTPAVAASTP